MKWLKRSSKQANHLHTELDQLKQAIKQTVHDSKTPLVTISSGILFAQQILKEQRQANENVEKLDEAFKLLDNALFESDELTHQLDILRSKVSEHGAKQTKR